ncbi:YibE/F family protein [Arthrobacter sp. zg-Y1219]|uniref:YibE/F family protein n=1 Tax=Arthrobacter sp. zg-Y1219 TaxID=3049067 RepID=UPI0024C21901|nr:YibE/F family protein [Arthrobacter sp. zg-Y1219]MDK1360285.1 YibE/F family protein [Arthrobacter sp. zg-Y1219]
MGHSHSPHSDEPPSPAALAARRRANWLLTWILVPLGLLAVVGMVLMWPSGDRSSITVSDPYATADGVKFDTGEVQRVSEEDCPSSQALVDAGGTAQQCLVAYTVPNAGGPTIQIEVPPEVAKGEVIEAGDTIRYLNLEAVMQGGGGAPPYVFVDFVRSVPMAALTVLYAGVVIAVARWRGLRALVGLVGAYAVLAGFILPGLVEGKPPLLLGLIGSSVIMFGVLYFAHGFTARTSTALLGTLFGLSITACLAAWATDAAHLVGVDDENAYTLINSSESISVSGIILCGLIISGLGVLNDVTITQSSAVWEMYELAPGASAKRLFSGAMRVGRDHIASTVYTIAFAYAGAALPVLILVSLYDRPFLDSITSGELAEEVIRTLVGSVGLVLAIPVTTAVAVLVVKAVGIKGVGAEGSPRNPVAVAGGLAVGVGPDGGGVGGVGVGGVEPHGRDSSAAVVAGVRPHAPGGGPPRRTSPRIRPTAARLTCPLAGPCAAGRSSRQLGARKARTGDGNPPRPPDLHSRCWKGVYGCRECRCAGFGASVPVDSACLVALAR